jgi:hypothetical protein
MTDRWFHTIQLQLVPKEQGIRFVFFHGDTVCRFFIRLLHERGPKALVHRTQVPLWRAKPFKKLFWS